MTEPKIAIAITADDKTAKGAKAAEKRLGNVPKHVSAVNRRAWADDERRVSRHGRAMVRTFGSVEQAGARIFGGRSITSGFATRLGAAREAAAGLGTGLGEASAAGGVFSGAMGAAGVVAAGTVGILAAAGYAAVKFANDWADGAAKVGRTASIIGVSTKALQEFEAASQRAGMAKGAGSGALGSLSQTLNDARYGRNSGALAVLGRMGVSMKTKADGTVDVEAMLPAIADALARQNSSGRRTAGGILGISPDALPVLTQGGKALAADMKDADAHAAVLDDGQIATGSRIARKGVMVGQLKDRALAEAGAGTAGTIEGGYDAVLSGGRAIVDGASDFKGAVDRSFRPAAEKIDRAAGIMVSAARAQMVSRGGRVGRFNQGQIASLARHAVPLAREAMRYGFTEAEAKGIAANVMLESGGDHRSRESGGKGPGRGLIQWTDPHRKAEFRRVMGVDVEHASRDQQWRFLRYETQHKEKANWQKALAHGQDAGSIGYGYSFHVERSAARVRDSQERAAVAEAMPVHVTVELKNAPTGTRTTVRAGRSSNPAISHAMQH